MTEMSSQIVTGHRVHPQAEVQIRNGEIWVRGPVLFQGYYTQEGGIHLPLNEEGWFVTKDLGKWENGQFQVIGRQDNQFISGGENIQPEEVEQILKDLLGLEEAYVVPITDEEFGSRPVAFLKPFIPVEVVREKLMPYLPKFKIPIRTYLLPESDGVKVCRESLITQIS
jgi:O-succinylbenzoic acid--CoA ligase